MNFSFLPTIHSDPTRGEKYFRSWSKFIVKRKLIKNLLLTIKCNVDVHCKTNPTNFDNISVILPKLLAKFDVYQLQKLWEIAQIVYQLGRCTPFTSCITSSASLFRRFHHDDVSKILWMTFRFPLTISCDNIKIVRICSNKINCVNPFHCALMETDAHMYSQPHLINDQSSWILKSLDCHLQIDGYHLPTKFITPPLQNLSSVFAIYYDSSTFNGFRCYNESIWRELGICFYLVDDLFVMMYNFSSHVIFVSSICIELPDIAPFNVSNMDPYVPVHRILPDHSLRIFGFDHLDILNHTPFSIPVLNTGIVTIQISFGKGWGKGYKRSSFIYCPKRCEVSLRLPKRKDMSEGFSHFEEM